MKERILVLVVEDTIDKLQRCKDALGATTSDVVRQVIDKVFDDLEKK